MNERIKELAKKVDSELAKETIYCTSNDLEKFAELIVRECAKTIEDVHSKDLGDYLKEVFGVKE